jgi:hypothetical protein
MGNDGSTAARQFVANPPFWGAKVASITTPAWQNNPVRSHLMMTVGVFAFCAIIAVPFLGVQSLTAGLPDWMQGVAAYGVLGVLFGLLCAGTALWYRRSQRKILLFVTNDNLTVTDRPGDVYPFNSAKLGTWGVTGGATMGTALHLQCGPKRFVLGGRDRRVAAGTRLEAPDVGYGQELDVDAWVSAEDFEEILAIAARRSGLDIRPPGPGDPTRCLLFPNPMLVQDMGFRKRNEFMRSWSQPSLAIDVTDEGIRVIDPKSNSVIASVSLAQVTATPATYRPTSRHWFPTAGHIISDSMTNYLSTMPYMVVSIPGVQPLTIGGRDTVSGVDHRFEWRADVPVQNRQIDYAVSGTDWMTLVDKFGLAPYLITRGEEGAAAS